MNADDIRRIVVTSLTDIAPEADPARLDPKAPLRDALDLDSMDFLNFVIALHKALKVDIPESDYRQLATLDGCVTYLCAHVA